jgi:HlyD family secretion protein
MSPSAPTGGSAAKPQLRRWLGLAIAALLLTIGAGLTYRRMQQVPAEVTPTQNQPAIKTITALGRLEPQGEMIQLSAPTSNNGNRVDQLLVKEGDLIKAGQVIAVLDTRDRLQTALAEAQENVKAAQAKLAITQAGAKQGEVDAQRAEIARLTAQGQGDVAAQAATVDRLQSALRNAQTEYRRYQTLHQEGAVSASDLDSKRLTLETGQKNLQEAQVVLARIQSTRPSELNQARANLARIKDVRPVDVDADQVEVKRAIAAANQAKAALDQAYVRSPTNGTILEIHTRAGEVVGNDGIVEIGQTQRMYAVAEVYQSDIQKVRSGQRVKIQSDSIPGELKGTVDWIDSQVRRQQVINTDPTSNTDARIVEVHIALNQTSSQKAARLTNLQVTAVIEQ